MKWPFSFRKKTSPPPLFESKNKENENIEALKSGRLAVLAFSRLEKLFSAFGPRPAGSSESRSVARALAEDFRLYSDDSIITSFRDTPGKYYGYFRLIALASPFMLLLAFFGQPFLSLLGFLYLSFSFYNEVILYKKTKFVSFFPKKDLTNVHAVIEPEEVVMSTVIFSSHHDSAPLFKYGDDEKIPYFLSFYLPFILFLISGILVLIYSTIKLFQLKLFSFDFPSLPMAVLITVLLVLNIINYRLWFFVAKNHSPGCGDNLISSCLLVEVAHYFFWKKQSGKGLKHTRLIFVSFDGEEVGLLGSKAWYDKYEKELINPININIDSLFNEKELSLLIKDANGSTALDKALAAKLAEVAEKMGYEAKVGSLPFLSGATDAASAANKGIRATSVIGIALDKSGKEPYHTQNDIPSSLSISMLEKVISILIKYVEKEHNDFDNDNLKTQLLLDTSQKLDIVR